MKSQPLFYDGALNTVYHGNVGDKVPRHGHTFNHLCFVIQGKVDVEVYSDPRVIHEITPDTFGGIDLPANIDHEIRVAADNTIFINMVPRDGPKPRDVDGNIQTRTDRGNRVKMADGSYVYV